MDIFSGFLKRSGQKDEQEPVVMDDQNKEQGTQPAGQPELGATQTTDAMQGASASQPASEPQATMGASDGEERKSVPIVEPGSVEEQIKGALRQIYDPEIGLEVIQLGLIREIDLKAEQPEIKMMLTTPFCPYGGWLIQQVKDVSESVYGKPIKINVLPDMWDPNMMEDPGLLAGW